ncbi:hypothetical protein [uncultured Imperialibacter sp.]|uniref:hypothetical protein n=1 Tax=uncultured Imperialibacter sp. TaxID=1672639 RepID=UPI0030DC4E7A
MSLCLRGHIEERSDPPAPKASAGKGIRRRYGSGAGATATVSRRVWGTWVKPMVKPAASWEH